MSTTRYTHERGQESRPTRASEPARAGRGRVVIEDVTPQVDGGRFPAKRVVGDVVRVEADVFADGHEELDVCLRFRKDGQPEWQSCRMARLANDRWAGEFRVEELGRYEYTVAAWIDRFQTWRRDLAKRVAAGQPDSVISAELGTGARLVREAAESASAAARRDRDVVTLNAFADLLDAGIDGDEADIDDRTEVATTGKLQHTMQRVALHRFETEHQPPLTVVVEPRRAVFSAWYEMFPRSAATEAGRHGTFRDVEERLPYVAELGFDVLYLPPIHPIGTTHRKGPNNTVQCDPGDPGSPWAIGTAAGGHRAIHPDLGTEEDFQRLLAAARDLGIDVALDIAFQASPDHPWVDEHPEWFRHRADGSIACAENPPKVYEDIYPLDFESEDWEGLWTELREVFAFWLDHGVSMFRVDNPHTKSLAFWEWCIPDLKREYPHAIFLSEAFTRPKVMHRLAKLGFSMSYTYFPWRNTGDELRTYLTELTKPDVLDYLRASQWTNTPDILTEYLQLGGRAAFVQRLVLAATLGACYGIYGPPFELMESRPLQEGSEEYRDSEKYEIRRWDLDDKRSLRHVIARVNRARRENEALHSDRRLYFHTTDNEALLCYSKSTESGDNAVLVVVNLDPHQPQAGWVHLDLDEIGVTPGQQFQVHDEISNARYLWQGSSNFVELDPAVMPAHLFRIRKKVRSESDFDYYL